MIPSRRIAAGLVLALISIGGCTGGGDGGVGDAGGGASGTAGASGATTGGVSGLASGGLSGTNVGGASGSGAAAQAGMGGSSGTTGGSGGSIGASGGTSGSGGSTSKSMSCDLQAGGVLCWCDTVFERSLAECSGSWVCCYRWSNPDGDFCRCSNQTEESCVMSIAIDPGFERVSACPPD
jgi:hypothetical protein